MLNSVELMGRLVADPQIRTTTSGVVFCTFTLACNRRQSGEQQVADFIDCIAWRGLAETIARFKRKGDMLVVEGRIETRTYEAGDGSKRKAVGVKVHDVTFCGERRGDQAQPAEVQPTGDQTVPSGFEEVTDDQLPF